MTVKHYQRRTLNVGNVRTVKGLGTVKSGTKVATKPAVILQSQIRSKSDDAVLSCERVRDWWQPWCKAYRGMQVLRQPSWVSLDIQHLIEQLWNSRIFGNPGSTRTLTEVIQISRVRGSQRLLEIALSEAAARLLRPVLGVGLPKIILQQIQTDAEEIGMVIAKLLPNADQLSFKLQLLKDNACLRWHQDHYQARGIVSYNCSSTEYIHHDHVNFWELNHCGNNDHIVQDRSPVRSVGVGNVLFIKGNLFPHGPGGLVHRAPDYEYDDTGEPKTRLCLKVDVQ